MREMLHEAEQQRHGVADEHPLQHRTGGHPQENSGDGIDGNDMFHINWGWGYLANGYFKLSALNVYWATDSYTNYPGTFSMEQIAAIGISPKQIEDTKTGIYVMDMSLIDSNSNRLNADTCEVSSQYGLNNMADASIVIRFDMIENLNLFI